jgi:monofunctional biosynthetic peptidoglycan transglycosylase
MIARNAGDTGNTGDDGNTGADGALSSGVAATGSWWRLRRLIVVLLVAAGIWVAWEAVTWPDVRDLVRHDPATTAFIEEYRLGVLGRLGLAAPRPVQHKWVPYGRISSNLKVAILIGEDADFFAHHGFDSGEMEDALREAWEEKRLPRGASTLSQQLAKNLWLSRSRNPLRKVKEAALTRELEKDLTKRRIFEIYLNVVEFGDGIYGAEAASRHYFAKSAAGLSQNEAAQLSASLPYPHGWHPGSRSRGYLWRVRMIARRMGKARWLWGEV